MSGKEEKKGKQEQSWVYPSDAKFPGDCCEWAKSKDKTPKYCLGNNCLLDPVKHYHRPLSLPDSGMSWKGHLDVNTAFSSPHAILAYCHSQRFPLLQQIHKMIHEMMIQHHDKPTWVFPSTPLWLCDSVIEGGKPMSDIQEHLKQAHMVNLFQRPFYIPGFR